MFSIVLRLKADGAKANPDRGLAAVPDLNEICPILRQRADNVDKFYAVDDPEVGTVYGTLREAQEEWRTVKNAIFTKEQSVQPIITKLDHFKRYYGQRGLAHEAFIELQVLNPVRIDSDEVDLELL